MHRALRQQLEKPRCAVASGFVQTASIDKRDHTNLKEPVRAHSRDLRKDRGGLFGVDGEGRRPDPAIDPLVANEGLVASRVKADSRRRRGPKGRLYRACHEAILGHQVEGGGARRWVADFRFPSTL
jgi:hypothetical protein